MSDGTEDLEELERLLGSVEAAMVRLDAGTYGRCEGCGSPIGDELLGADPTAVRCAACAAARTDG